MPRALWLLMRLQVRGVVRRMVRRTKSVRGAFFFLLGLALLGLWLAQAVFSMVFLNKSHAAAPEQLLTWAPVAMLALSLTVLASGTESSLAFRPAEIDFLFPAPFTRRQLLIYKLTGRVFAGLFSALFFSIWMGRHGHSAVFVVAGCWLAIVFVQLLPVALAMIAQSIATAAYSRLRRAILLLAVGVVAWGAWQAAPNDLAGDWTQALEKFLSARPVQVLLAPFTVFVRAIVAPRLFPDFLQWAGLALAINGMLVGGILWLDANYFETSLAATRRLQDRLSAMRRGGAPITRATAGAAGRRLPMLPWLAGAGPIAWRQATTLVRTSWWLWLLIALAFGFPMLAPFLSRRAQASSPQVLGGAAGGIFYVTLLFTWTLRFDFRAEMSRMDWLKMLPLPPLALAAGELLVPCVATAALQCALWTAACLFVAQPVWILAGVALSLPLCGLLFGIENLLFLLFPPQTMLAQALDLQTFGRQFVLAMVKALAWLSAALVVGLPALAVSWLTGGSIAAGLATVCLLLAAVDAALLAAIAWAFKRFDVSRDLPGQ